MTRGYKVFLYNNASTQSEEVERVMRDWVSTVPWIGGSPERSTKVTFFLVADLLMIALTGLTFVSTKLWLDARSKAVQRNGKCWNACGYDLAGLPAPVCPECGTGMNSSSHA